MKLFRSKTRTEQGSQRIDQLNDRELQQLLDILPSAIESSLEAAAQTTNQNSGSNPRTNSNQLKEFF